MFDNCHLSSTVGKIEKEGGVEGGSEEKSLKIGVKKSVEEKIRTISIITLKCGKWYEYHRYTGIVAHF